MEGTLASILMFGGNFSPAGWAFCQGQLLAINQYTALFALIGTTYGGNGTVNFALPDLRNRTTVGVGQGPGLGNIDLGQTGGSNQVTLNANNLPTHTHTAALNVASSSNPATSDEPFSAVPGGFTAYTSASSASGNMGGTSVTLNPSGGGQATDIQQPYLGTNFVICLEGIFPSRN